MAEVITAIEAYQSKAQALAQVLASRIGGHYWLGYTVGEELEGKMLDTNEIVYWRPLKGHETGFIRFKFIESVNASELSRKPPRIIKEGEVERRSWDIDIGDGTTYDEMLSHTFSETISESHALAQKWYAKVEAEIGWQPAYATGGISASLKATGQYGQDITDTKDKSNTTSDTLSQRFVFTGPKKATIIAERSVTTQERLVVGRVGNAGKIYFYNGSSVYEWRTIDNLISAIHGHQPKHLDNTVFGGDSQLRQHIIDQPPTEEELALIGEESDQRFEFPITYHNVVYQRFREAPYGTQ